MKCDSAREYFSDLIEKSLEPGKQVAVEAHLSACPTCHAEFTGLQSVWSALELPYVEPPVGLGRNIRLALREEEQKRLDRRGVFGRVRDSIFRPLPVRKSYAMAAAAVLLVVLPGAMRLAAPEQFGRFTTSVLGVEPKPVLTGVSAVRVTPVPNPTDPSLWDLRLSGVRERTHVRVQVVEANPIVSGAEYAFDIKLRANEGMRAVTGRQVLEGTTTISAIPLPRVSDRGVNVVIVDLTSGDSRRVALFLPTNSQLPALTVRSARPQSYITALWRVANDFQTPVVADVYLHKQVRASSDAVVGLAQMAPQAEVVLNAPSGRDALNTLGQAANLDVRERGGVTYLTRKPQ